MINPFIFQKTHIFNPHPYNHSPLILHPPPPSLPPKHNPERGSNESLKGERIRNLFNYNKLNETQKADTAVPSLLADPAKYPLRSNYTEQLIKTFWQSASRQEGDAQRIHGEKTGLRKGEGSGWMDGRTAEKVADATSAGHRVW